MINQKSRTVRYTLFKVHYSNRFPRPIPENVDFVMKCLVTHLPNVYEKKGRIWSTSSCSMQVKDEMSLGSSSLGLPNCNWSQALKPVAYNMVAERGLSSSGQNVNVKQLFKLQKAARCVGEVSLKRKVLTENYESWTAT